MANLLQSGVASAERVFKLLDEAEQSADPVPSVAPNGGRGRLMFKNVSFAYSPDKPLITDLSLVAEPGQTVAIVGPTGAGKATLVNLMMRFYELDAGRITLDGVDVTVDVPRRAALADAAWCCRTRGCSAGRIRDNIAYGRPGGFGGGDPGRRRGRRTWTGLSGPLPEGYDTVLEDEGGQRLAGAEAAADHCPGVRWPGPSVLILV